jgi:hypothetical protein
LVGLTNVVSTLIAIGLIDKIGRKLFFVVGVSGIIICMFSLAYQFNAATFTLTTQAISALPTEVDFAALYQSV